MAIVPGDDGVTLPALALCVFHVPSGETQALQLCHGSCSHTVHKNHNRSRGLVRVFAEIGVPFPRAGAGARRHNGRAPSRSLAMAQVC